MKGKNPKSFMVESEALSTLLLTLNFSFSTVWIPRFARNDPSLKNPILLNQL